MDKEKEIEEMAKFILKNRTGEDSEWIANGLYDMGYRKADEVRKETAKEIITRLRKHTFHKGWMTYEYDKLVHDFMKEYGVEVDE